MKLAAPPGPGYHVDEDSDEYGAISSDEEGDELLRDELLRDEPCAGDRSDEFEKEMDAEIRASMSVNLPDKNSNKKQKTEPQQFYDDVYFNSSDEDESGQAKDESGQDKAKVDRRIKSNDELFYDPKVDEKDEQWVQNKRRNYLKPGSRKKKGESSQSEETPDTSATLCCPACMTVLCRDCQQHETYVSQFRAMFVFNCLVLTSETLSYKTKEKRRRRRGEKEEEEEELYNPVKCAACQTKVGVFDKEEVYHFFNVLAT